MSFHLTPCGRRVGKKGLFPRLYSAFRRNLERSDRTRNYYAYGGRHFGLVFEDEEVVTFGRHVFAYDDDLRESVGRYKAGLGAPGVVHSNGIVWEIDHEKPEQDILVEIPEFAVRTGAKQ